MSKPRATRWPCLLAVWIGAVAACAAVVGQTRHAPAYELTPALLDLPEGRWIKIHQQRPGDAVTFARQPHGGSAFDSRRGRLVLFGSDTHGRDWANSPLVFDLARMAWQRLYPDDGPATYAVTDAGLPVAGPDGNHPWAMHTFGAVTYDPAADVLVVASYPEHMSPGRFTDALTHLWPRVRRHPTWALHLGSGRWEPLDTNPVHFFAKATAFDTHRGVVMGYAHNSVYEFSFADRRWRKVAGSGWPGWANNVVYDSSQRALITFGDNRGRNDIGVYKPASGRHRVMPTPGPRPKSASYVPMAFHPGIGRTVALVDRPLDPGTRDRAKMRAETWLYDLENDAWTRLTDATLPFGVGMNYNLDYDPGHGLLLLVADPPGEPVAVWALRL